MAEVAAFQWRTDVETIGNYGEGVSRPRHNARVRDYKVMITLKGARPMIWYTRAESKRAAETYARNRWPDASAVEVAA